MLTCALCVCGLVSPLGGPHSIRGARKLVGGAAQSKRASSAELSRALRILGPADRAGPAPGAGKKHLTRTRVAAPGGGSSALVTCVYLLVCV